MRFDELVLRKYGSFEGCELPFPHSSRDFHLIAGPNEAGKSTAMEAVTDLLFGFPHGKSQDYKFDATLLRVAATLQDGTETLTVQRKRGKVGTTLLDDAERIVPEGRLISMLAGQTRDSFRLAWCLSHKQLRDGGQSIAEAKDDIGQAIFAAGSGLVGVAQTLAALDAETDRVWKKKGSTGSWNLANKSHQEASQTVKARSMRPKDWLEARDLVDSLRLKRDGLSQSIAKLRSEEKKIQRVRRLASLVLRFVELKVQLNAVTSAPLTLNDETAFEAALLAFADAQRKEDAAAELISTLEEQQSHLGCDPAIVAVEYEIGALVERRGAVRQALEHIPKRETELQQRTIAIASLLTELGMDPTSDIPTLLAQLPARAHILLVRERARECDRLLLAAKAARAQSEEYTAQESLLKDQAKESKQPDGLSVAKSAVITARTQVQLDEKLRAAGRAKQRADRELTKELAALHDWSQGLEALAALQVLSDGLIEQYRSRMEDAQSLVRELETDQRQCEESIAQNKLERQRLVGSGKAVTYESLLQVRSVRNDAWNEVRDHLFEKTILTNLKTAISNYEGVVGSADEVADNRYSSAAASSRAEALNEADSLLELQLDQIKSRLGDARLESSDALESWSKELSDRGLPNLSPLHLREWLTVRGSVLRASAEVVSRDEEEGVARQDCAEAGSRLWRALPAGITAEIRPATFTEILEASEAVLVELEAQQTAFEKHSQDLARCERDSNLASQRLKTAEDELKDAEEVFKGLAEDYGLPGIAKVSLLDMYEELRLKADAASDLPHRIETMKQDVETFRQEVKALGQSLGLEDLDELEMLEQLRQRLAVGLAADARASQIALQIEGAKNERQAAEAMTKAAKTSTLAVTTAAGETDIEKLKVFVASSRSLRLQLEAFADLRKELLSNGDGLDIDAILSDAEGFDSEAGESREAQIVEELGEIDAEHSRVATELGVAQEAFRLIDVGSGAITAAADAEMSRADMAREAEAYVFKKTQSVILRWLIERQRQTGQSPLLLRASELFRRLTLGRYSGLVVDSDGPVSRLLGLAKDGNTTVSLEPMSDGTKDQLYLALRIAAIEQSISNGVAMPFLADDLFINFDDKRARAGFEILAELSRTTQVLFFTHHTHLVNIAREVFGASELHTCDL